MVNLYRCRWIWIPLIVLPLLAIVESKKTRKRIPRFSNRDQENRPINDENHQQHILPRTSTMIDEVVPFVDKKMTLLELEKGSLFTDLDQSDYLEESTNETHVRVKRTNPDFDDNYLEDLADSFPRGDSSQHWTFKKRQVGLSNDNDIPTNRNLSFNSNVIYRNITDERYQPNKNHTDSISNNRYNLSETSNTIESMSDKKRIKREKRANKNVRRRVVHGKKRKLKKHAGKKETKKKKTVSSKRSGKRLSNLSKISTSSKDKGKDRTIRNNLPNVIDDYQVESRIEKRDSSDAKSEVDIAKREISNAERELNLHRSTIYNEIGRDKRDVIVPKSSRIVQTNLNHENIRDSTIPKNPNESTESSELINPEIVSGKVRNDRAVKSIEDIRELAERLVTKVNELQNYLGYENTKGKSKPETKKRLESREIDAPTNVTGIEEEVVLETPQLVDECVRIGELSSALKTLDDRNVSLEKSTNGIEIATERIRLSNDRSMGPLTKRMVRKGRIKRKSRRKWGRWTGWSSCSVTCGKGRQIRWRHCLRDCSTVETEMEEKTCQLPACPPGKFLGIF